MTAAVWASLPLPPRSRAASELPASMYFSANRIKLTINTPLGGSRSLRLCSQGAILL